MIYYSALSSFMCISRKKERISTQLLLTSAVTNFVLSKFALACTEQILLTTMF